MASRGRSTPPYPFASLTNRDLKCSLENNDNTRYVDSYIHFEKMSVSKYLCSLD